LNPNVINFQGHFSRYLSAIFLPLSSTSPLLRDERYVTYKLHDYCLDLEQQHGSHALSHVPKIGYYPISNYALNHYQVGTHNN